ncbi:MAG: MBL fold metallo-hydrolase [Candidatus Latescibacteria bacterium]|nr:MBL fold metallo-hydrolase [Candidatus Latescibacterota bacterium]
MFTSITDHLFWLQDTCSVYLLKKHEKTFLIDCGTHVNSESLKEITSTPVDTILLTHFHRDQCSAAFDLKNEDTRLVLPFAERRLFEETDLQKASYDTFDNYTSYYQPSGPRENLIADEYAYDYESVPWQDIQFEVVPLPGHTYGAVGYLFEIDDRRVLACGDLMSAPGKIHEYFWSQWAYMDFKGHINHLESLKTARELQVDLILPGHGKPFVPEEEHFESLQKALEELYELFHGKPYEYFRPVFRHLTEHVIEVSNSMANTYIIKDDEGHALLHDSGYVSHAPITANPHRYIDHLTPYLEAELGIHTVEWFLPSHYHDDHLAGYPALSAKYGTKVVSSPELEDILSYPQRYDMPCLVPHGMTVDHVVERGQAFRWRGIHFYIEQQPGQTWYHHLTRFEVDGKRFLSIGDNISGMSFRDERDHIHSFIPKNRTPVTSYRDMPGQILQVDPDILLTGHGGGVDHDRKMTLRWQDWMDRWAAIFTDIIDQPHPNLGMDPHWVEIYPYKVRIVPGDTVTFEVKIKNHEPESRSCHIVFRSVASVVLTPDEVHLEVPGDGRTSCKVTADFPCQFTTHALPVLADVTWNGKPLGEIAEAIGYW